MLEALQRNLDEESESRKDEAAARAAAQERCSAADERVTKLEWESSQATASLQRKVSHLQDVSAVLVSDWTAQSISGRSTLLKYHLFSNRLFSRLCFRVYYVTCRLPHHGRPVNGRSQHALGGRCRRIA